jgi:hypothetical protein
MGHLQRQFERLKGLKDARDLKNVEIEPLSKMADDDLCTPYSPLSHNVLALDATAFDHIATLQQFIVKSEGGIPTMSGYTLIRTSIEASSIALWLMGAGTKDKRIMNTLRLLLSNRADVENFAKHMGSAEPLKDERVRRRLDEVKDARPSLRQHTIQPMPSTTSILEGVQKHIKKPALYTGIQTWIACSGIAHANNGTNLILLERKQVGIGSPHSGTFLMTSSVSVLSLMFQVAVDFLEASRQMYETNSLAPGGHYSLPGTPS